jgi:hypothetical protein
MVSSDFQEAKNVDTLGANVMPNTRRRTALMHVVGGVAVDWLTPAPVACVRTHQRVLLAASSTVPVKAVLFSLDGRRFAIGREDDQGIWSAALPRLAQGRHTLDAAALDSKGRRGSVREIVRACSA